MHTAPYSFVNQLLLFTRFTQVTEVHHEALHEINSREFHYFQKGTFPTYFRRDPSPLSTVKQNYSFGARYSGLQEPPKKFFNAKLFALVLIVFVVRIFILIFFSPFFCLQSHKCT